MPDKKFYFGTAGWSYQDWVPHFYPKGQSAAFDWLEYYSNYFNCVEVNSSYYAYVNPKVAEGWVRKVDETEDFSFTIKLHQDFTHKRTYNNQNIKDAKEVLEILNNAGRFGGLLIQFPYSFGFNDSNVNYVKELREIFQNYNCFLEIRHESWDNKTSFDLLQQLDLVYTTIDQPMIGKSLPFKPVVINGKGYIRLHGRNKGAWSKSIKNFGQKQSYEQQNERYDYLYSPGELTEILQMIQPLLESVKVLYIVFNNHPKGKAAANTFQFMNMLESKKIKVPETTIKSFPQLKEISDYFPTDLFT